VSGVRVARVRLLPLSCILASAASLSAGPASPEVHALLINGGDRPGSNYQSHLHHLQDMVDLLHARGIPAQRIDIFSADGQDPAADLTTRDSPPADFWLLDGTGLGNRLRPQARLVNTRWDGVTLHPARLPALREWFEAARKRIGPGDRLLLFVTDHGTADKDDPDGNAISLWREKLTVRELKSLLGRLAPGVQVVMVMSQCYSGAFANVIGSSASSEPSGDVCGFFSTTAQQKAYGCYPEGRDRDKMGHAFHFIEALGRRATTADAHQEVLAEDDTPDVPLRTSDAYLARLVAAEAAERRTDEAALVDSLLAQAWRRRAAWEPEIRMLDRIGAAFGTFSPRRLSEIAPRERELEAAAKQISSAAERWKAALGDLQEAVIADFRAAQPDWRARLEPAALDALGAEGQAALLDELLPPLLEHARRRPELWTKLETFRSHAARGAEARWRMDVRKAALQRTRTILVGIAGRVLVGPREALARLQRCEAFTAGSPPVRAEAPARTAAAFPPLAEELALLEEISPSWLGVQFRSVPAAVRAERRLPAGANVLDAVYPDSPAREAGLEAGDIVLGPPGRPFDAPREMREWAMTSPRGVPLPLLVVRPADEGAEDREFEATLVLRSTPMDLPNLAAPPSVGDRAPLLTSGLKPVGSSDLPDLGGQPHLLFFWATWCGPCKQAVPEVMAFAQTRGLSAVAITDEDEETVGRFLAERQEAFFARVAVDPLRRSFIAYGVSGTPTVVLVDGDGVIRHRQVGYLAGKGLTVDGWSWPRR
jgi:thiol-disulfide isomerase/thioredoxin